MNRFLKLARNPWLLGLVAALMLYTLAGFSLVPFLVRHYIPRLAAEQLQRKATVGDVQFNPFLFTFEANDFALEEQDGRPLVGFRRLFMDFELKSLIERAWTFAEVRLEGPSVDAVLDRAGGLNLAKITDSLPKSPEPSPPPAEGPPPRILLHHLALTDGSVKFTDLAGANPATETVGPINLELEGLSTLPDRSGTQRLEAQLPDGGRLTWRGDVALNPLHSSGEVQLVGFRLAPRWKFVQDRIHLAEPGGEASLSARYRFSRAAGKTELAVEDGRFRLAGLRLTPVGAQEPWLSLEEIAIDQASVDLGARAVRLATLALRNGQLKVAMDPAGVLNWQGVITAPPAAAPAPPPSAPVEPPWRVAVEKVEIAGLAIHLADASHGAPLAASIGDFGLTLGAEGELGGEKPKARVDGLKVNVNRVAITTPGQGTPLLTWDALTAEGGRLDLEQREATLQRLSVTGGGTTLGREADGTLYPLERLAPKTAAPPAPAHDAPSAPAWRFSLGEVALQDFHLALADRSLAPEIAYDFDGIRVTLKNVSTDGTAPVAFEGQLKVRQGGALQASGSASPKGDHAQAKIKVERFDLKALQPLVAQYAALKLESGDVSTDLAVDFQKGDPNPTLKAAGNLGVNGLQLNEAKTGKRFLAWKSLTASGIGFGLGPDKLAVKEVRIVQPGATLAIFRDHSTNIAAILKPPSPAGAATPAVKAPPPQGAKGRTAAKPGAARTFPVVIERIRVDDGVIDYSDDSLVLPFATRIEDFDGAASGVSTAPKARVSLKFAGRVGEYGQVNVDGSLNPMQMKAFSDVDVVFRNVAMSPLSPYSATFAGRKIQSGRLNMDVLYKIDDGHLRSNNKIVLDQLVLGERVESPNAVNLPLDLAVALLTDSDGKINADIPVEGDVNKPQFGYGKVVWDAIVTLIKKAVTAPFNAIASLFGGSQEDLGKIEFEPGRAALPPPEREKLKKVAVALAQRPKLKLTVHGTFDSQLDGEALRSRQVRDALAKAMDIALQPGEDLGPPGFGDAATQKALERLADARGGPKAMEEFQAAYEKSSGRKPQRVGALGGFLGRPSDDTGFYEKLYRHLVDTAPLPQAELTGLAEQRGKAILAELAGQPGLDKNRLGAGKTEAVSGDKTVPVKLELGAE
ncbi:DUF748 domain-containing protein [Candidatus Methylocalor cossyra]|uniref:DUF748 domain-containing protein n=1 Tax=Candidatus Methylocalor cossyra TaxID=3108543 RepID=A0ABM9NLL5_9GAMM